MSKCKINGLKYPASDRITSRISTLNRSMACTLMHRIPCSSQQESEWLKFFPNNTCAYCGKAANHLDHLYPMINGKRPSGYGTEPGNLVPCCETCNRSKGNELWETYMRSSKCAHIGTKNNFDPVLAMEERITVIKNFQIKMPAKHIYISNALLLEWDKLVHDLDQILDRVETTLQIVNQKLYLATLSTTLYSASTSKTKKSVSITTKKASARVKLSEDQKLAIVAFYMRNNKTFMQMDEIHFGVDNQHGVKSYNLLKKFGVTTEQKGLLIGSTIDDEIAKASGVLKDTLIKIKDKGL